MNIYTCIGNLTADPKIRTSQTNDGELTIATFSIAINNGKDLEPLYLNCVAFNQKATLIRDYLTKGSKVGISGALTSRTYEKDGVKGKVFEVIISSIEFLSPKKAEETTDYKGDRTLQENEQEFKDLPTSDDLPF